MKKILSLLVAILLILNVTNSKATEEVNGDISPDEGFSGNPSDFYSRDKEYDFWHEYDEYGNMVDKDGNILDEKGNIIQRADEEVNGDISPDEGFSGNGPDFYKHDKMIYVAEGYVGYNKQLDLPVYMQKTIDFGGPASIEMVIDYFLGPVNNQETYAKFMKTDSNGTNLEEMEKAINHYQNKAKYELVSLDSLYHFMENVMGALDEKKPIIADISTSESFLKGNWAYSMKGHYLVISGCRVDEDENTYLTILDPYVIGKKEVRAESFYSMIENHHARSILR